MNTIETRGPNSPAQISSGDSTSLNHGPTITSASWLFLISFGLVVIIGGVLQDLMPGWELILTEVVLILLPTIIYLRIGKYPLKQKLQLRWPSPWLALLSLLVSVGLRPGFLC